MDSLEQLEKEIEESLPSAVKLFIEQLRGKIEYLEENPPCCGCDRVDIDYFDEEIGAYRDQVEAYKVMYESLLDYMRDRGIDLSKVDQFLRVRHGNKLENPYF